MAGLQSSGDRQATITCCLGSMPWAAGAFAAQMAACVIEALCSALLPTYLALRLQKALVERNCCMAYGNAAIRGRDCGSCSVALVGDPARRPARRHSAACCARTSIET